MKQSTNYMAYFEHIIAQEVHLRGVEKFDDIEKRDQDILIFECKNFLNEMIEKEHKKQYGCESNEPEVNLWNL